MSEEISTPVGQARVLTKISRNVLFMLVAQIIGLSTGLITLALLARHLGKEGFGKYSLIICIGELLGPLADMGMTPILVREIARGKEAAGKVLANVIQTKALLVPVMATFALLFSLRYAEAEVRYGIVLYAAALVAYSLAETFVGVCRAFERMEFQVLLVFVTRTLWLVFVLVVILGRLHFLFLLLGAFVANSLKLIMGFYISQKRFAALELNPRWSVSQGVLRESLPFGISVALRQSAWKLAPIVLADFATFASVGLFSGAMRLVMPLRTVSHGILSALAPTLSSYAVTSRQSFAALIRNVARFCLVLGIPVAVGLTFAAEKVVVLVLGAEFLAAARVLQILCWATFLSFLNVTFGEVLLALGKQRIETAMWGAYLIVFVPSTLLLAPRHGAVGVAIAVLVSELLLSLGLLAFVRKEVGFVWAPESFLKHAVAALMLGMILYHVRNLSLHTLLAVGGISYVAILMLFGTFSKDELKVGCGVMRSLLISVPLRMHVGQARTGDDD